MFTDFTIVLTILLNVLSLNFAPRHKHITKRYSIHGIDVSHHQKYVDWQKIADHSEFKVSFCILKATEGATHEDTRFINNWKESSQAGIIRGAYHFYHPTRGAAEQAKNFINNVILNDGDLAPVLDFEKDSPNANVITVRKGLMKWLQLVEKHYGIRPIIYTNTSIYNKYIKGHFKNYSLWLADYKSGNIHSLVKSPNLKFWQYTEKGKVSGITGNVDINAFVGADEEFESLKLGNENYVADIELESVSRK
jgi:lysozyme